jgi:phenylpyruvate tautomerase PptA (4-oxalocrotonate tautomerase family)
MPLVRIDYRKGIHNDLGNKIGAIVYRSMVETINVPENDNFQIITEHEVDELIYDPDYLGIHRSNGIIIIQITLNEGRTTEMKKAFYKMVAESLHQELGLSKEDIFLNLVEVKKENWSFGNGVAQYAQ